MVCHANGTIYIESFYQLHKFEKKGGKSVSVLDCTRFVSMILRARKYRYINGCDCDRSFLSFQIVGTVGTVHIENGRWNGNAKHDSNMTR